MPVPTDNVASEERAVRLVKRPELKFESQLQQGRRWWVVKDPLTLKYFRLRDEQYAVLNLLDGETTLLGIRNALKRQFPGLAMNNGNLRVLMTAFHRSGLVISDATGQGAQLLQRRDTMQRRQFFGRFLSVLWIRLPGLDPDRFLSWLHGRLRWLFSPLSIIASMLLILFAAGLVTVQFDTFHHRLPQFHEFFHAGNIVWMMVALGCAKILHELGHGLVCKHFGSECHQLGLMFLVFTPCLYCDTSDAWMLPNKWKRAAIGAAGIYVELVLAAVCTLIWWHTEPGLVHYLCLSTMTVCSVSTLVFNANPLLRYDGYYILSDLIEIPNLSRLARNTLLTIVGNVFREFPEPVSLPPKHRRLFLLYTVAAPIYRLFVVVAILWFLAEFLEPYGLKSVGHVLITISLLGIVVVPCWQLYQYLFTAGMVDHMNKGRMIIVTLLLVAVLYGIAFVPLPHYADAAVVIRPRKAERIYVDVPGRLVHTTEHRHVTAGQTLVTLHNPDLNLEIKALEGRIERLDAELRSLRRQESDAPSIVQQIPPVEETITGLNERLQQLRRDFQRLTLVAPSAGILITYAVRPTPPTVRGTLPLANESVFSDENLGMWLERGTMICQIGQPEDFEAVLIVEQSEVDNIQPNRSVRIKLDEFPNYNFTGKVSNVSSTSLDFIPSETSSRFGGRIQSTPSESGAERSTTRTCQIVSTIDSNATPRQLLSGMRGQAKVRLKQSSLASRFSDFLRNTLRFRG